MNMSFWFDEVFRNICRFGVNAKETLFSKRSEYQLVEVMDTDGLFMKPPCAAAAYSRVSLMMPVTAC